MDGRILELGDSLKKLGLKLIKCPEAVGYRTGILPLI